MTMPDYADIWETTDTVIMERPRSRREDREQPESSNDEPSEPEPAFPI